MDVREQTRPALGTGIYSLAEAARLLSVTPRRLRGWAEGYRHRRGDEIRTSAPVLDRDSSGPGLLTFRELIELFFVREFIDAGVKLPKIRAAHERLRAEWETPYPFAFGKLFTDGKELLIAAGDDYHEVASQQSVFSFAERFFKDVDFDEAQLARCWWPLGHGRLIVLDPTRAFGAPIEVRHGIRTEILYNAFAAENGDAKAVADWYETDEQAVLDAVAFEERWRKAA